MSRETPGAFALFDLLARSWRLPAPVESALFNATGATLAASLADGRIALLSGADAEPPEKRIVVDEAGRRTIAPRRSEPRPAVVLAPAGEGAARLAASRDERFLAARGDGVVTEIAPDGAQTRKRGCREGAVRALDHAQGITVIVSEAGVEIGDRWGGADWRAREVAISPDGEWLAFGGDSALWLTRARDPFAIVERFDAPGPVGPLLWSDDGAWLAAGGGEAGFALVDRARGRFGVIGGFPTAPRSLAFARAARAVVASGAFRIAAWDLAQPPFDDARAGALETGRPGLVGVTAVATHPTRPLAAGAWANGQIAIAALGGRDELLLRPAGPAPSALIWSSDGRTLAVVAGETLSLVSLPDALFK